MQRVPPHRNWVVTELRSAPGNYRFVVGLVTVHPWIQGETHGQKSHCCVEAFVVSGCCFEIQVTPNFDLCIRVGRAQVDWLESLGEKAQARRVTEALDFSRVWCTTWHGAALPYRVARATSPCVQGHRSEFLTHFLASIIQAFPLGEWAAVSRQGVVDLSHMKCPSDRLQG